MIIKKNKQDEDVNWIDQAKVEDLWQAFVVDV
jgi:hypothetical protein